VLVENMLTWMVVAVVLLVAIVWWKLRGMSRGRPAPEVLRTGQSLPEFSAVDEKGNPVQSSQLIGSPAVLLFVRGTWCPFCSRQVENLTTHYKEIADSGARLILLTPQPLETTRRVADFFEVDFEFWLDESLHVTKQFGLLLPAGVPDDYRKEYGTDTIWPASLVVDAAGIIRYSGISRFIIDRPNPEKLLNVVKNL
jgi:peroxiredoxin